MKILVTGAAGFIGSHFVERLLATTDADIVAVDNFDPFYSPALKRANVAGIERNPRVVFVEEPFDDQCAMDRLFARERPTHVVHLGAHAGVARSVREPLAYLRNNVEGTASLLEASRRHVVERFLIISSSTVYGREIPTPFIEDGPLGIPASPYGASKRGAEILGATYAKLYGVPVTSLRPFSVYGPRLRPDLAMCVFSRAILTGRPVPLHGDGTVERDFTHVSDICSGIAAALTAPAVVGETINLGHDQPVSIGALVNLLAKALGRAASVEYLPSRPEDLPRTHADLSKAGRLLGYRPVVPLSEGLDEFARWFRDAFAKLPDAF